MLKNRSIPIYTLSLLFILLEFATLAAAQKSQTKKWWWRFAGPAKETSAETLDYANELLTKNKNKKAVTQLRRLANFWPESSEAPLALYNAALLIEENKDPLKAFEVYQQLIHDHAGEFDYEHVLNRQFEIAKKVETEKIGGFLLISGFVSPEKAIPLYMQIVTNAPQWSKTAEAYYRTAAIYKEEKSYRSAIDLYEQVISKFPKSPFAELSGFHKADSLYVKAKQNKRDSSSAEAAWAAFSVFLNDYPESELSKEAFTKKETLYEQLAEINFKRGVYYQDTVKRPESALIAYNSFITQFPNSSWTSDAKKRIDKIESQLNKIDN